MRSVWKSFASVRLAIFLMILLALASVVGTLIPQGRSAEEYAARYGDLAGLFAKLQLTSLYRSSWFLMLLFLFAVNLTVCTVSRLGPRLRRAFRPPSATDAASVAAMRVKARVKLSGAPEQAVAEISRELAARRYAVRTADGGKGTVLLARKRKLGWFGSDAVHIGLLVILAGGIVSGIAGRRAHLPLIEGQTADVPHAGFQIRLDRFETEYYPQGGVKAWKSTVSVLEDGMPVRTEVVLVNRPLVHRGFRFYQSSYGWDWQSPSLEMVVGRTEDPSAARSVTLRTGERVAVDGPGITHLGVRRFVPDFVLGEGNRVLSRSNEPRNPAAWVEAWRGEEQVFAGWIFANFPDIGKSHGAGEDTVSFVLKDYQASPYSVLEAAKDPGAGLIWLGCLFISAGLFLAFYWAPREIRAVVEPGPGGGTEAVLGGFAAKGREAFKSEFEAACKSLRRNP